MNIEKILSIVLFVAVAFIIWRTLVQAWKIEKELKKLEAMLKKLKEEDGE